MQKAIDKEKEKDAVKLIMGLSISRPAILLHGGDDWCWFQYYAIKHLERDAIVFIREDRKEAINIPSTESISVNYYKDSAHLKKILSKCMDDYIQKIIKYEEEKELMNDDNNN